MYLVGILAYISVAHLISLIPKFLTADVRDLCTSTEVQLPLQQNITGAQQSENFLPPHQLNQYTAASASTRNGWVGCVEGLQHIT